MTMKEPFHTQGNKNASMPLNRYMSEGMSQRDRAVKEVMEALFNALPDDTSRPCDFTISNGTKCWIKKFHPPKHTADEDWIYGFDVKFGEGAALSHLEFSVRCSGWERVLAAPTE